MSRRATPATDQATASAPAAPHAHGEGATGQAVPSRYEDAVLELETIVSRLETGRMPLDELLAAYQRGVALVAYCQGLLAQVEGQMRVLDEQGMARRWQAATDDALPPAAGAASPAV
jgi:exodeoxyribonuclease VII small subunit